MFKLLALAVLAYCGNAQMASAQVCGTFDASINVPGNFSGNSCGKNLALATLCAGGDGTNGAGSSIFQLSVAAAGVIETVQVTSTTAGFNPELAIIGTPCSSLTSCLVDDTNNTQTVGPDSFPQLAGSFFIIVTDLNSESPGCGDFNLAVNGFITPVHLQEFSID